MRLKLATKIEICIFGVLALALISSTLALWTSWQIERLMQETVTKHLPSLKAAADVEIELLEQRGFVTSYLLDGGNSKWLDELASIEPAFKMSLTEARQVSHTADERKLLDQLDMVYGEYVAKRKHAIDLYREEDTEGAKREVLENVYHSYRQAHDLCEELITANQQYVQSNTDAARQRIRQATVTVGSIVAATVVLSGMLLWLFFQDVLRPLRKMVEEVRTFSGADDPTSAEQPLDELHAMGSQLRALMSDVQDTRSTLQRSRSQLIQSEKLATVGKLAASVAHEIRNPLTAIKMWLFSIRKSVPAEAQLQRKFDMVSDEMSRLESVVQNFLEFSRPPAPRPQSLDVEILLDKTLELLAHRHQQNGICVVRNKRPDLPHVTADPEQIKQVLINLLANAAEAMCNGGAIRISTSVEQDASGTDMVVVRVADDGCGMPADAQRRIFDPFFTTKDEGTGLGLCIAARIMVWHGGRVLLESSTERGSCFAVWIPVNFQKCDEQDLNR